MRHLSMRLAFFSLVCGLLTACGGVTETDMALGADEPLGTSQAAVCSGSNISSLTIQQLSLSGGLLSGSGQWQVAYPGNAVRLEYYIDNSLYHAEEHANYIGTWSFSRGSIACGYHTLKVKAYAMVIDSNGNRTTCWSVSRETSQGVNEPCPSYCGDYTCDANEDRYNCPQDCSYCGDYVCDWNEDYYSCPWDCGGGCGCGPYYCEICP